MTLITKHFGVIEVEANDIITFAEGLPGFINLREFIIMFDDGVDENAEAASGEEQGGTVAAADNTFVWLQSVDDGELCFILVDAAVLLPWYQPVVLEESLDGLDIKDMSETLIYNIARFPENISEATVNLMAPVVINAASKKGKQVIVTNQDYGVRHYLFEKTNDPVLPNAEGVR
jgi:flagellar assembly factor FliW